MILEIIIQKSGELLTELSGHYRITGAKRNAI